MSSRLELVSQTLYPFSFLQFLKEPTQLIAVRIPQPRQGQQTENKKSKKLQIQLKKPKLLSKKSLHYQALKIYQKYPLNNQKEQTISICNGNS